MTTAVVISWIGWNFGASDVTLMGVVTTNASNQYLWDAFVVVLSSKLMEYGYIILVLFRITS